MNPLLERKLFLVYYVVLYAIFSAACAVVFGLLARMSAGQMAVDWIVFGLVSGLEGIGLWSVLKYWKAPNGWKAAIYYLAAGVLFTAVAAGAVSAAAALSMGDGFPLFARTIPARILVLVMAYVWFALYYAYAERCFDEAEAEAEPAETENRAAPAHGSIERITIRGGQKIKVIPVGEIIYIQADGDYAAIVTAGGRFLKEQTMKHFEENLPRGGFVRVHRSFIVSVGHISRIEQSGRQHSVVLCDGTRIRISDGGYKRLRGTLGL